jgi:hypothetical protein
MNIVKIIIETLFIFSMLLLFFGSIEGVINRDRYKNFKDDKEK